MSATVISLKEKLSAYKLEAPKVTETPIQSQVAEPADLWGSFQAPDLPKGIVPIIIDDFAFSKGEITGADPAGYAIAALTACAAAIPDRVKLKVKQHDEWYESARLWSMIIGDPSTKKSPILSASSNPLVKIDHEGYKDYARELSKWDDKGDEPMPIEKRIVVNDATVEAVQNILATNTEGVLLLNDELSGFFGSMGKYTGGKGAKSDRAFWLQAHNGGSYRLDRVGRKIPYIENLSVNIIGGIQPDVVREVANGSEDDGLIQRFIPIILKKACKGVDKPIGNSEAKFTSLMECLRRSNVSGVFGFLQFDEGAQAIRDQVEERYLELQAIESVNRKLGSHFGKYEGLFARLCVVFHCIENADQIDSLPDRISEATAQRVSVFLEKYVQRQAFAFYMGILDRYDNQSVLLDLAGYILAHKKDIITTRDLARSTRQLGKLDAAQTSSLFEQMMALGWIVIPNAINMRDPKSWQVNPRVHVLFKQKGAEESARRQEIQRLIKDHARSMT